ncbi:MAG: hypothetical protein AB7T49_17750 [Oligoflexales bacterium]
MKGSRIIISDLDFEILMFLWHWKVATTSMLGLRLYGSDQSSGIYQRLARLERAGYILARAGVRGKHFAWTLTEKGFSVVRPWLKGLQEDGFRSENVGHDLLVSAVHLGSWIRGIPEGSDVFTEQQLRRYPESEYPEWVPRTSQHRPDGYWKVKEDPSHRLIALEVELSRKTDFDYHAIADFYAAWKRIYQVVWVVEKERYGLRLAEKLSSRLEQKADYHNFLTIGQFVESGWQAKIIAGSETGKSLQELVDNTPRTDQSPVPGKLLMNAVKVPFRTEGYRIFSPSDFCR